jgi:hypothetical protein
VARGRACRVDDSMRNPASECRPWCSVAQVLKERGTDEQLFSWCHGSADVYGGVEGSEAGSGGCASTNLSVSSVCLSTFNDDIGTAHKFIELANVHLQDLLVCAEMFLAAVLHRHVFSFRDFEEGNKQTVFSAMRDMVPLDVFRGESIHHEACVQS